jgi:DNA-binding transcriptional MerR regulator/methylmalonyl-CoA mutase cobalamin-binding subunit
MYTISRAAEQIGISTATLRAWERRYAVVHPQRTEGAYRVYSNDDLRILRTMKHLVDEGWSAGFAAQEVLRGERTPPENGPALPDGIAEAFVAAAAELDAARLDELLDQMFAVGRFETVATTHLFPALQALGDAWASGRVSVAGEHLAAHAVGRRLAAAYDAAGASGRGARIVIGLAPGSRHELGLLAFAAAARRTGLRTDYLGADVPVEDWLTASGRPHVQGVVMAIHGRTDVAAMAKVTAAVHRHHPGVLIAVGGADQDKAPSGVLRLGHDFAQAAQALAQALT